MLNLSDKHIGILAELYWNGYQFSRTTPGLLKEIEALIEEGFIDEFKKDLAILKGEWFVKLTEAGKRALMEVDPVRVFHHYMETAFSTGTLQAACTWVAKFTLDQLPMALAHENKAVRGIAERRLKALSHGPYYYGAN